MLAMLCGVEGVQAMLCGVEGVQVMLCGVEGVLGGGMWGKWSVGDAMWCLFGCLCPLGLCIDCMPTGLLVTDQYRAPPPTPAFQREQEATSLSKNSPLPVNPSSSDRHHEKPTWSGPREEGPQRGGEGGAPGVSE